MVAGHDPGSRPSTFSGWGEGCFVIDQWYARQQLSKPGSHPVKEIADAAKGPLSRGPAFSYDELTKLR